MKRWSARSWLVIRKDRALRCERGAAQLHGNGDELIARRGIAVPLHPRSRRGAGTGRGHGKAIGVGGADGKRTTHVARIKIYCVVVTSARERAIPLAQDQLHALLGKLHGLGELRSARAAREHSAEGSEQGEGGDSDDDDEDHQLDQREPAVASGRVFGNHGVTLPVSCVTVTERISASLVRLMVAGCVRAPKVAAGIEKL